MNEAEAKVVENAQKVAKAFAKPFPVPWNKRQRKHHTLPSVGFPRRKVKRVD
jgi:hypothetical protein